jgi:diacylglycerol kinase family enzyme
VKLLLIVNPTASTVTAQGRVMVEDILASDHDLAVAVTTARDHATELARSAVRDGVEVVVVIGGDGTLNEAANGLVGSSTALGALPGGSTSVFARTIGFTNSLGPAAKELAAALARGSVRRVEMGTADGRHYLFHLGVGFDAEVVRHVEGHSTLKRTVGQAAFVYSAVATWLSQAERARPQFTVSLPGGETVQGSFAICLNTNPYSYLGKRPLNVAPAAGLGQGLAVAIVHDLRLATIGGAFRCALGDGRDLARQPGVTLRTDVESLTISASRPFNYQVDGDYLGRVGSLDVALRASCLDIVVP